MFLFAEALASGVGLSETTPAHVRIAPDPIRGAPEAVPVRGPWRLVGVVGGVRTYEADLPVRPRVVFFTSAPEGMKLVRDGVSLKYGGLLDDRGTAGTWEFSADSVMVRVGPLDPRPVGDEYRLLYPQAQEREAGLHPSHEEARDPAWPFQSAQVDDVTRQGVYLPAPSEVAWTVDVPAGAVFRFTAGILPPEMEDGGWSDGADLHVRVGGEQVGHYRVLPGEFRDQRVPLDRWAGQTVRLELGSADRNNVRDHVFVGNPQVYVPTPDPRRLVLVFVDTLRRDHLGIHGYPRAPAPGIDALATRGTIFEDARSVAPWTLPSTRSVLTGQEPELWRTTDALPQRLARLGWATAAYVGNVYLTSNFDMAAGWGEHAIVNWPPADLQVDRALDFFRRHADQDAMAMVHFMDLHLPYKEPFPYMGLYAGERPEGVSLYFTRTMLMRLPLGRRAELKQYLVDRYDQNLRYVDDALDRLLRTLPEDATVVFFADHGEEFFDHGDLEHGHTLYDELLRVPMFFVGPGFPAARVKDPVSLVDLTPTVLDHLGLPAEGLHGRSLLPLARGEETDPDRAVGFGRVLYGNNAWGSVRAGLKYTTRAGQETLHDLRADPTEEAPLATAPALLQAGRAALGRGTGFEVREALRFTPGSRNAPTTPLVVTVPGGVEAWWAGEDPTMKSEVILRTRGDQILATFTGMYGINREVFVVPRRPLDEVLAEVQMGFDRPVAEPVYLSADEPGGQLGRVSTGGRSYVATRAFVPLPVGEAVTGTDAEMQAALNALGYAARPNEEP